MRQQHETDLNDPKQRFGWALRDVELNGIPAAMPQPYVESISNRLSRAGFLHIDQVDAALVGEDAEVAERILSKLPRQEIHYQPPLRGQDHPMNTSGKWIPIEEPVQLPAVKSVERMTPAEKKKMIDELKEEGLID